MKKKKELTFSERLIRDSRIMVGVGSLIVVLLIISASVNFSTGRWGAGIAQIMIAMLNVVSSIWCYHNQKNLKESMEKNSDKED